MPPWLPSTLHLAADSVARSKCLATISLKEGSRIFSEESFANVLLIREKGKRCDACFRLPSKDNHLKRCSGCGCYWYCDVQCQNSHWALNHKRICPVYNPFMVSGPYQILPEHEKLDALLLSYTIARLSLLATPYIPPTDSPAEVLMSLLPHPIDIPSTVAVIPIKPPPPDNLIDKLYPCFGNNNFVIHSHLTGVGHGVFPLTSRLFNHSCMPNAVAKYRFSQGQSVLMEIVALRDIHSDEEVTDVFFSQCRSSLLTMGNPEICIPYLDPALLETRSKILQISYGFNCACHSCTFINSLLPLPPVPTEESDAMRLADELRQFVGIHSGMTCLPTIQLERLPVALGCVLREDYISSLSEEFSRASHEGDYPIAFNAGLTLLALYVVIYPPNYPQIGMHLLELTKSAWNALFLADITEDEEKVIKERVRAFLNMSNKVLTIYGLEGDEDGPMSEIKVVESLLSGG